MKKTTPALKAKTAPQRIAELEATLKREEAFNEKILKCAIRAEGHKLLLNELEDQKKALDKKILIAKSDLTSCLDEASIPLKNTQLTADLIKELKSST